MQAIQSKSALRYSDEALPHLVYESETALDGKEISLGDFLDIERTFDNTRTYVMGDCNKL